MAHPNQPWPWKPATHPFRVCYSSTQRSYWDAADITYVFETEAEMRAFAAPNCPAGWKWEFHEAVIPEVSTWSKHGHWKKLAK